MRTLSTHFRDLLLVTVGGPAVAAELTPEEVTRLQQEQKACQFTPPMLLRAIEMLNEAQGETRWNNQHRLLVELTFLKLMTLDSAGSPSAPASTFATAPIVFPSVTAPQSTPSPVTPSPAASTEVRTAPPAAAPQTVPPVQAPMPTPQMVEQTVVPADPPVPEPKTTEEEAELPVGFFANDRDDDEDGIDEDEFGEDTETPSLFGDVVAEQPVPPAPMTEPEETDEEDEDAVPFFTDEDEPYSEEVPVIATVSGALPPAAISLSEDDEINNLISADLTPKPTKEPEVTAAPREIEEPDDGIRLDIRQVQQVWNRFLTDAGKISKQTEVMMSKAYPTETEGKKVTITFSERMHFERMNEPSKLQFVRKLLARCLNVENVVARFVLDENVAPAPV
jgi:hypothetical protein